MENTIQIKGGKKLSGEVTISSSKNATVAILPAVVLASEVVKIFGVPDIDDVDALVKLLNELNIFVSINKDSYTIDPTGIANCDLLGEDVSKLRASYYFLGALLGRFKHVKMKKPGGCNLGPRPIDLHLKGFEVLGAKITTTNSYIEINAEELIGDEIYLDFASVGATINIMLAAVLAKGRTIIQNAAKEPEIIDLSSMLNKMGAKIRGAGTSEITIDGVYRLKGCIHDVIPDRIEAGTYIILASAIGENVLIKNVIPQHIEALLSKLEEIGVEFEVNVDSVKVIGKKAIKPTSVTTQTFPGFATDLQQPLTAFLTLANGFSIVTDTIYPERFKHCLELIKMGAEIELLKSSCRIKGPIELKGADVSATDLRCGACLIIAGLIAKGTTTIHDAYHIFRGYDSIVDKLKKIGADIQ